MNIALLQINPTVGDIQGNRRLIVEAVRQAAQSNADLAVTPELALVGYLPRDFLLSEGFVHHSWHVLEELAHDLAGLPPTLIGLPEPNPSDEGRPLYNTAALVKEGLTISLAHDVIQEDAADAGSRLDRVVLNACPKGDINAQKDGIFTRGVLRGHF